jgi:hypothetical protein
LILRSAITLAAVVSLAAIGACTGGDSSSSSASSSTGGACPEDLPAACPSPAPSYAKDVAPVIQASCTPCHAPGGKQATRLLTTYDGAHANRSPMLNQIHACRMPPRDAPPLTPEGRAILLAWLVCGAPND